MIDDNDVSTWPMFPSCPAIERLPAFIEARQNLNCSHGPMMALRCPKHRLHVDVSLAGLKMEHGVEFYERCVKPALEALLAARDIRELGAPAA